MIFELTISGLCAVVLKSDQERPVHPEAVDVVCPEDGMHRPRLAFSPDQFRATKEADLTVDAMGNRIASIDLSGVSLGLAVLPVEPPNFTLGWAPQAPPPHPPASQWMNWVPTLTELGFKGITLEPDGRVPPRASTRLTLCPGELFCRDVVKGKDGKYMIWKFPVTQTKRAVANQIVYRASGIGQVVVTLKNDHGTSKVTSIVQAEDEVLRMSFCNDLAQVKSTYYQSVEALNHLKHLDALTDLINPPFQPPSLVPNSDVRTESPICNQTIHVYPPHVDLDDEGSYR